MAALRRTLKLLPTVHRTYVSTQHHAHSVLSSPNKRPRMMISPRDTLLPTTSISRELHTSNTCYSSIVPFKLSDIGEGIAEVTIKEWYVKVGDEVAQFDNICEVQSDKATVTITCRYDGIISAIYFGVDDTCKVGQALVDIQVSEDEVENVKPSVNSKTPAEEPVQFAPKVIESDKKEILTTPAVRKMAADNKVDLSAVLGTGKGGRITKDDLVAYIQTNSSAHIPVYTQGPVPSSSPIVIAEIPTAHFYNTPTAPYMPPNAFPEDRTIEIKGIAKVMVSTMSAAQAVPRFTYHDEYDMEKMLRLKRLMKHLSKEHNVKVTFMAFLIKAASKAIVKYPMINAHVNADCTAITYKASHNIGIATDTPHGLMVPNIKNVQNLSILDIANELQRLKTLSYNNKLSADDVTGGTFSLSNVGAVGGTYASPMLVVPEVCIGAFGKVQARPTFNSAGNVVRGDYMCVSWAGDHRVLDGATVARYSNTLKEYVENPASLLFHLK